MTKEYGMFSKAGNLAVDKLVNKVLALPITASDESIYKVLEDGMKKMESKHGEVYDTDVRDQMISSIERKTNRELTIYFLKGKYD